MPWQGQLSFLTQAAQRAALALVAARVRCRLLAASRERASTGRPVLSQATVCWMFWPSTRRLTAGASRPKHLLVHRFDARVLDGIATRAEPGLESICSFDLSSSVTWPSSSLLLAAQAPRGLLAGARVNSQFARCCFRSGRCASSLRHVFDMFHGFSYASDATRAVILLANSLDCAQHTSDTPSVMRVARHPSLR